MMTNLDAQPSRDVMNVALAYFINPLNLNDAASDLCLSGFHTSEINITGLYDGIDHKKQQASMISTFAAEEKHTWRWRLKRFLAHDRHRRGADQISGQNPDPYAFINPECNRIDLGVVLAQMKVPPTVLDLLEGDTLSKRMFMLVDAKDRVDEAGEIMKRNFGELRTEYLYSV